MNITVEPSFMQDNREKIMGYIVKRGSRMIAWFSEQQDAYDFADMIRDKRDTGTTP